MPKGPDSAEFVERLAPALRQAASIARALEGRVANRPKSGEATAVKAALTIADTAAQEAILVPMREHFACVSLEAEEETPSVSHFFRGGSDALVVVDPIDGTLRFYLEAMGPYGVMIGLALGGIYEAALVALPREDIFFHAVRGRGAQCARGDEPARPIRVEAGEGNRVFVSHDLPEPARALLRARGYLPQPACGGAISVAPLLPGVRAGLRLARGEGAGISVRGRIGARIAAEAGALVRCETGAEFPDGILAPARALLCAADPESLADLRDSLAAAEALRS